MDHAGEHLYITQSALGSIVIPKVVNSDISWSAIACLHRGLPRSVKPGNLIPRSGGRRLRSNSPFPPFSLWDRSFGLLSPTILCIYFR